VSIAQFCEVAMAFKRSLRSRRFVRRRAPIRRKRFTRKRAPRFRSATTRSAGGSKLIGYRGKKLGRRQFNSILWKDTLMKQHYRSLQTITGAYNSQALAANMTITFIDPFTNGSFFWTAAGGAIPEAAGGTVPLFDAKITLRGGKWTVSMANNDSANLNTLKLTLWHVRTISRPDTSIIPTTAPAGWDPSLIPDFTYKYGKVFYQESVQLKPQESYTIEKRIGIKLIDQSDFTTLIGNTDIILLGSETMNKDQATAGFLKHTLNCSFSADAIGTT